MAGKITFLKNTKGERVYPVTSSKVVMMEDGITSVDEALSNVKNSIPSKLSQLTNDIGLSQNGINQTISTTQPTDSSQGDVWIHLI